MLYFVDNRIDVNNALIKYLYRLQSHNSARRFFQEHLYNDCKRKRRIKRSLDQFLSHIS